MDSNSLEGRVAIFTGAGRGIGRCIALSLARNGARVTLAARTESQLRSVQAEIEALGGVALSIVTDITSEPEVIALIRQTVHQLGGLDIVVNNAGIGAFGPLAEATTEQWDRVMAVNARGTFLVCREAIPHLRQHAPSYIVNMTSVVGVKGYINQALYGASKHAVMGMSKALAKEVQKDGIRVHAVCPGAVDTEMAGDARPDLDRSTLIVPDEIADVVLFLVTRHGNAVIDEVQVRRASSTPWA
jgi:3-oxoacyl-[acyl-carrier protein] reductase